jgi:hypothetical protein
MSDRDDLLIRRCRRGKQLTMVVMFVGCLELVMTPILYYSYHRKLTMVVMFVGCLELVMTPILYYSYHRNPIGREFLFPPEPL